MLQRKSTKGSTRRTGDMAEDRIVEDLQQAGWRVLKTANSGAAHKNGDFTVDGHLMCEVKYRVGEEPTFSKKNWTVLLTKAQKYGLTPVLINDCDNASARQVVVQYREWKYLVDSRRELERRLERESRLPPKDRP